MKIPRIASENRLHIALGWGVFLISLLTYLLTLEPTVSYWDCPEYVTVAYGVQPGHPPGNPVWMLAARFFINFAPSINEVALMVNAMSGVCSALTVLLTFLATVLLAKQLVPKEGTRPMLRSLLTEGAGVVAALALCWSDTFWFSAVEAEVYAFSSLTTALLFWLTLVWSRRVKQPHSDRYLIAIAYILGLSIGVHELNLLCLPALLLIVAFTMREELKRSRIAAMMICSIIAIALVLYGLIPGFMSLAERVEFFCANSLGWSYNMGAFAWWVLVMLLFMASVASLHAGGSRKQSLISVVLSTIAVGCSGLFFFSGKIGIGVSFTLITGIWLARRAWKGKLNVRRLRISMWCLAMVIIGFSAYAALIVRSAGRPPLNTGEPSDIYSFHRYFSREQYGKNPLVYGPAFTAKPLRMRSWKVNEAGDSIANYNLYRIINERPHIVRAVPGMRAKSRSGFATEADSATNARQLAKGSGGYVISTYDYELDYQPEMCMWFPRMVSRSAYDINGYAGWSGADTSSMAHMTDVTLAVDSAGRAVEWKDAPTTPLFRPTYMQNLRFFLVYQCGYMYWRYFLWNFVGRQNDYAGHGEPDCGNFITGFTPIDEAMLDNVEDAPGEISSENPGRNVYYMLPLLLGILGIVAQCRSGVRGRRGAIVIAVLFIVTGIAIVFYLNQGPAQARDRDYSFAGSFYAWCIWMGLGTIGIYRILRHVFKNREKTCGWISLGLALCVPLQMLSQTADDHDRSGRTVTRDMAANQLASLKPDAILFSAEDNYLFPTLYLQQVERMRPDVRMVSMPYMVTDWYAHQLRLPLRNGSQLAITAPEGLAGSSWLTNISLGNDTTWVEALPTLKELYVRASTTNSGYVYLPTPRVYIDMQGDTIRLDLRKASGGNSSFLRSDALLALDLLASNAALKNPRPVYVVTSVANSLLGGQLQPYLSQVGTVSELHPGAPRLDANYIARMALHRWNYGGASGKPAPYFDPVAAHNLSVQRRAIIQAAYNLSEDPSTANYAIELIELVLKEMPANVAPYEAIPDPDSPKGYTTEGLLAARSLLRASVTLNRPELRPRSAEIRAIEMERLRQYKLWAKTLRPSYRQYISFRVQHLIDALDAEIEKIGHEPI